MIVKMMKGRKSKRPAVLLKLVRYAYNKEKMIFPKDGKTCFSKQFLRGFNEESWIRQLLENDSGKTYNNHIRRVILRHEVASFAYESTDYLLQNRKVLLDIGREYMKRRSSAPGIACTHIEEGKQVHIHFVFGATNVDGSSNRLNNMEFRKFKKEMEEFQRTKYPELHHSEIDHGKKKKDGIGVEHMPKNK